MFHIVDYTDDFWWIWSVFYLIMETNVVLCFLIQDFQWGWTMYGFTHNVSVSFADGFAVLLSCILYCFCTCIFDLYFVITEAWYESTGRSETIDDIDLKGSSFRTFIG